MYSLVFSFVGLMLSCGDEGDCESCGRFGKLDCVFEETKTFSTTSPLSKRINSWENARSNKTAVTITNIIRIISV